MVYLIAVTTLLLMSGLHRW